MATGPFHYRDRQLYCEDVPLSVLAAAADTPVYVYSRAEVEARARAFTEQLRATGGDSLVCYAVKANGNPTLLRLLASLGLGADVTSGGELFLALRSGIPAERIIFSGVGKKRSEIAEAIEAGILALHVESEMELSAVAAEAEKLATIARVGVRINPNVVTDTHPFISTGLDQHKFGVSVEVATTMLRLAAEHKWLQPVGLAAHIGSQITDLDPYVQAVRRLVELAGEVAAQGISLDYIDSGGGLGIDYQAPAPSIADWLGVVAPPVTTAGYRFLVEPGRSIVGPAGALLTRVLYTKRQGAKTFVIVDAGMTDLLRPALYQAYHQIVPVEKRAGQETPVDVVGPICETTDYLARERHLPPLKAGDLVAVLHSGAYGFAMSSNYNGHLRPAEVLVERDAFTTIRRRQAYADLLAGT